ncbi:MAG: PhzF family phenazine biosynthesis protein [Gemmatimonadota bacterium]|nr:PhzF family phenazine biosynthesis protein [Gemmatimonadota bacterium]
MTRSARYVLADVFTSRPFGGNPLAVFPDPDAVPPHLMPVIARELNLSETVFLLPPEDPRHAARMRIFTPEAELPFAGHPTVGTACIRVADGRGPRVPEGGELTFVLEQVAGPVSVRVRSESGGYSARFDVPQKPVPGDDSVPEVGRIAESLSLEETDLAGEDWAPRVFSCGVPFLIVPVRDLDALSRARLNSAGWERWIAPSEGPHVYLIAPDVNDPSSLRARMFAPALGVPEDPATGAAASALAGYLAARDPKPDGTRRWRIEQGVEMGRPSLIELEADERGGVVSAVRVGGGCVLLGEGRLDLLE